MKVLKPIIIFVFISFFMTGTFIDVADAAEKDIQTVILGCMSKNNPPYTCGDGEEILKDKPGIRFEHISLVEREINKKLEQTKIKIVFERYPWMRLMITMKAGKLDGIFSASFKEQRLESGLYPMKNGKPDENRRMSVDAYYFYTLKDSGATWDGKKLNNFSGNVSIPRGYSAIGDLDELNIPYETSGGTPNDLKKMIAGRVKVICALELPGDMLIKNNPIEFKNVIKINPALMKKAYYLMFSHQFVENNRELAELIWDTIGEVRNSEDYKNIVATYY